MKKFLKIFFFLLTMLISGIVGFAIHKDYYTEIVEVGEVVEKVIEVPSPPKIIRITDTVKISKIRDGELTDADSLIILSKARDIAENYLKSSDFHRFNFSHDFKPDSS